MSNNLHTSLFNLSSIHQKYWKDFCDVCYSRFSFEQGEVRTYEQKYETFCRCRGIVTEDENYKNDLLYVKESDLQHFVYFANAYFDEKDAELRAMQLATMDCWLKKLEERLRKDYELTKYISPRSPLVDYAKYKLPGKLQIIWNRDNCDNRKLKELNGTITNALICHLQACYEDNEGVLDVIRRMELGEPVWGVLHIVASYLVDDYNNLIDAIEHATSLEDYHTKEDELNAFIYRLFMSYGQSLREIKELVEEYPSPRNLEVLKSEYERLVGEFEDTKLGEHWIECIEEKDGLQHIAKFFMHKRKRITEEEEQAFFYTLDKICIISDILEGKAEKYWLEVEYPDGWNCQCVSKREHTTDHQEPHPLVDAIREQTEVMKQTAEAMKELASKPTSIGQLNMGNGMQELPPSTNIPLIPEQ